MSAFRWLSWVASVLLLLASLESVARAAPLPRDVAFAPVPRWVKKPASAPSADAAVSETGLADVLIDDQLHLSSTLEHYIHRVRKVTSAAGVEDGAELELVFDPSHERVALHGLHVLRGSSRIDAAKTATIRTFDSEDGREHQVYDGSRRVVFLLADLRPGDVVDFEASVIGQNPVFGGRVARSFLLASGRSSLKRRVRVLSPASRPLSFQLANTTVAAVTAAGGPETEWVWEQDSTAPFTAEDGAPDWYDARPSVTISEYASWAEVAQWAASLYERQPPPSASLNAKIAEFRAAHATAAARAEAVVRFVQDDIRYLGIDLGEHSHRPHTATAVFEQRFGDCKDKVMLLVTMLRALGIEVAPALVNTTLRAHVDGELPSPQAFDHVIARLRLDGRTIWVDPTRTLERGPLAESEVPLGRALIASRATTELEVIPMAPLKQPSSIVRETMRVKDDAADLEVTSTYQGAAANDMRYTLSRTPRSKTRAKNLEFYAKRFPGIDEAAAMAVEDDEKTDKVVTREFYRIPGPVKDGALSLWPFNLANAVAAPSVTDRTSPLDLGPPSFVRHEIVIEGIAMVLPQPATYEDRALSFSLKSMTVPTGGTVTYELRTHTDSVPPADLAQHLETLSSIRTALDEDAHVPPLADPKPLISENVYMWIGVGFFAFVIGSIVVVATALVAWSSGRRLRWRPMQVGEVATPPSPSWPGSAADRRPYP